MSAPRTTAAPARARRHRFMAALTATLAFVMVGSPADAATGSIDHVEPDGRAVQLVVSLHDVPASAEPSLDTVTASYDGKALPTVAEPAADAEVRRTAVLALDVSNSMRGDKFAEAKAAAEAFLDQVPTDVYVGLVTFADTVDVVTRPTQNTDEIRRALSDLSLSAQTHLNEAVLAGVDLAGSEGSRSLLVLSDGKDTSRTKLTEVTRAITSTGVTVDVVALAQEPAAQADLDAIARAGGGRVLEADDPQALSEVFAAEAQTLAQQLLVTVTPTEQMAGSEGTLSVAVQVDGQTVTDEAFVAIPAPAPALTGIIPQQTTPADLGFVLPAELMYAGLVACTLALLVMVFVAMGSISSAERRDALEESINAYTRKGRMLAAKPPVEQPRGVKDQAVAMAASVLENQKDIESGLATRLEAAGLALKPAEWLLTHIGLVFGLGFLATLLSAGNLPVIGVAMLLGAVGPWLFLSIKRKKRLAAFGAQLADTLQLMAGSLSAGLSLAQSVDTVVREGADPMAAEFRRALVETRLGVDIEDALMGVSERMGSVDFEWVVMAIRIQREVGGNLSELLNKVAETIREREYLERQVKTLSAEGRMSVWILGGLPPGFMAYLLLVSRDYVMPMFTNPLGWAMLTVMTVLLLGGIFWMKKVVKVEI